MFNIRPLLFNIFINDLLFFPRKSDMCNFADDNTLYTSAKLLCHLIITLKQDIDDILLWFKINQMVANPPKFQVMFMGSKEPENFLINEISTIYYSKNNDGPLSCVHFIYIQVLPLDLDEYREGKLSTLG